MSLLIFGHQNPDTDSICSSIAMAYLKKQLGEDATACCLGEIRKEAQYALDYFKVDAPKIISSVSKDDSVCLVDHNEYGQSAEGLKDATVVEIVDHHKLGGMITNAPFSMTIRPVGCTCTILFNMFKRRNIEIPYEIAGLLLSAILSDTLLFKSPTTTDMDREACNELQKITKVDMEKYGMEMFKVGTSLDEYSIEEIVHMDYKNFNVEENKIGIGQVFTLDIDSLMSKVDDILAYIKSTDNDMEFLAITDIIKEGSYLVYSAPNAVIEEAFNVEAKQGVFTAGVVSRKKQLVPNLTPVILKYGK